MSYVLYKYDKMVKDNKYSACVLISPENDLERFLLGKYDDTYSFKYFRGNYVMLGGGKEAKDRTLYYTLRREITEEFEPQIAEEILDNAKDKGDYIMRFMNIKSVHLVNFSHSQISKETFETIDERIKRKEKVIKEGNIDILSKKQIEKGEVRGAWGHASILGDYLGIDVPEYDFIKMQKFYEHFL